MLLFLTMLSANLAVINFLPIPILDGGHMVFLLLEGILKRPVNERVVIAFHYAGFLFIISLMLFVLSLDIGRLFFGRIKTAQGSGAGGGRPPGRRIFGKSRGGTPSAVENLRAYSLLSGPARPGSIRPRYPNPISGGETEMRPVGKEASGSGATLGKDFRCRRLWVN